MAMEREQRLPKFRRPPVIEVVHGVQFRQLPMTIAHPGLFYSTIRDRYPVAQSVAPLPPHQETFDKTSAPQMFRFEFVEPSQLPRAWFVAEPDTMLVQLQSDRLHLNWRRGASDAAYPNFEQVSVEFQRVYAQLQSFTASNGLPPLHAEQCEMTYINHLTAADTEGSGLAPQHFLRSWRNERGPEWDLPPDDVSFTARYVLRNSEGEPYARLSTVLTPVANLVNGSRLLQLELTMRGAPLTPDIAGVIAFHEDAHRQIVRCFTGITTLEAQKKWDRQS